MRFALGDLVSRDGTDVHRVVGTDMGDLMIRVVCVKAPASGWCEVGEEESNLARRYEMIEAADHSARLELAHSKPGEPR